MCHRLTAVCQCETPAHLKEIWIATVVSKEDNLYYVDYFKQAVPVLRGVGITGHRPGHKANYINLHLTL